MYAIRQIQRIEDGKVIVYLPADFPNQQVEVIVLPVESVNGFALPAQNDGSNQLLQDILAWDTSHFDATQMKAYQRLCGIARKRKKYSISGKLYCCLPCSVVDQHRKKTIAGE